jgi:hypothetical protein
VRKTAYISGLFVLALTISLTACDTVDPDLASRDMASGPTAALSGGREKVNVCHFDAGAGTYHRIEVAAPALAAHLGHGDARPGDPVPLQAGYVFNEACAPHLPLLLQQLTPIAITHESAAGAGSALGDVTGSVVAVDINLAPPRLNTSGCEASDFAGFPAGSIALIQRSGFCTFQLKVANAMAAGAAAVVIFNQGDTPDREGLLSAFFVGAPGAVSIPVVGTTFAAGVSLAEPGSTARVVVGG